jgi:hypothetical protein
MATIANNMLVQFIQLSFSLKKIIPIKDDTITLLIKLRIKKICPLGSMWVFNASMMKYKLKKLGMPNTVPKIIVERQLNFST